MLAYIVRSRVIFLLLLLTVVAGYRFSARSVQLSQRVRTFSPLSATSPEPKPKSSVEKQLEESWKSGQKVFIDSNRQQNARKSKEPWWLSDQEKNNPFILPKYTAWWLEKNFEVDESWKVSDLQTEAKRRGLVVRGLKKAELIQIINLSYRRYSLTDDNFTTPRYVPVNSNAYRCYPEVYEKETS